MRVSLDLLAENAKTLYVGDATFPQSFTCGVEFGRLLQKIEEGIINHVYKLETEDGPRILRVFATSGWPQIDTAKWIDESLGTEGITHGKLLHAESADENFPYGFMISEFAFL